LQPLDGHENIYNSSKCDDSGDHQIQIAIYYISKYGACPAAIKRIPPGCKWTQAVNSEYAEMGV